jgi:hypothetical protein
VASLGAVHDFSNERAYGGEFLAYRTSFLAIPRAPLAEQAGPATCDRAELAPYVSVGWLLDGGVAAFPPKDIQPERWLRPRCVALQNPHHRPDRCEPVTPGTPVTLNPGSSIACGEGQLWVGYADATGAVGLVRSVAERRSSPTPGQ